MTWEEAYQSLCNLRCKRANVGDTICLEVCGEAGVDVPGLEGQPQPSCGEILETLGFVPPEDDDDGE
jgi:hypothetical protein